MPHRARRTVGRTARARAKGAQADPAARRRKRRRRRFTGGSSPAQLAWRLAAREQAFQSSTWRVAAHPSASTGAASQSTTVRARSRRAWLRLRLGLRLRLRCTPHPISCYPCSRGPARTWGAALLAATPHPHPQTDQSHRSGRVDARAAASGRTEGCRSARPTEGASDAKTGTAASDRWARRATAEGTEVASGASRRGAGTARREAPCSVWGTVGGGAARRRCARSLREAAVGCVARTAEAGAAHTRYAARVPKVTPGYASPTAAASGASKRAAPRGLSAARSAAEHTERRWQVRLRSRKLATLTGRPCA